MTITAPTRRRRGALAVGAGLLLVAGSALLLVPDLLGLGDRLPFVTLVVFRPVATVGLGVLGLALLAVRRRWWPTAAGVLVVVAVAASGLAPRVIPGPDAVPAPAGAPGSTLLSVNVDQGGADVAALAALLRARRPDLVVLPESADGFRSRITAAVPELGYRSWVAAAPGAADVDGVTLLAAPTVGPLDVQVLTGGIDPWLEATGGTLGPARLVAVHSAAPVPDKIDAWPRELASLQRWCAPGSGPAVLAGDFNATLDHAAFRAGTAGCGDTGEATGQGLTATWNAAWPRWFGAQIDHVLTAGGTGTRGLEVIDLPGTDHRALLTRWVWPTRPGAAPGR